MLRIYLENRYILFPGNDAWEWRPDDLVEEGITRKEMKAAFEAFTVDERYWRLVFTGKDEKGDAGLSDRFIALFDRVEAGGGLVLNEEGEPLLIYRNEHWDLPKGKLGRGETPADGALREVMEETGLKKVRIVMPLPVTYHLMRNDKGFQVKKTWWYRMQAHTAQELVPQVSEGILIVKWVPLNALECSLGRMWPSLRVVMRGAGF